MGITNTPSGRLWCIVGRFCCVGKNQSGMFLSMSSGGSMLRSDIFSLLQASIVTIAGPSLPLLISSPQRLTAWWCRFICFLFRVWLLLLRSMCGAVWSSVQAKGIYTPFGVLVCVYCVPPVLKDLFLLLKSHIWHGPEFVTELGMSKGLCIRLLCVRVVLCCTLIGRIMQFFPELVKQCICVSFTKVMVGVHVMF